MGDRAVVMLQRPANVPRAHQFDAPELVEQHVHVVRDGGIDASRRRASSFGLASPRTLIRSRIRWRNGCESALARFGSTRDSAPASLPGKVIHQLNTVECAPNLNFRPVSRGGPNCSDAALRDEQHASAARRRCHSCRDTADRAGLKRRAALGISKQSRTRWARWGRAAGARPAGVVPRGVHRSWNHVTVTGTTRAGPRSRRCGGTGQRRCQRTGGQRDAIRLRSGLRAADRYFRGTRRRGSAKGCRSTPLRERLRLRLCTARRPRLSAPRLRGPNAQLC